VIVLQAEKRAIAARQRRGRDVRPEKGHFSLLRAEFSFKINVRRCIFVIVNV